MSSVTTYPHITLNDKGIALIEGTRYKVLHLAAEHHHYGWSAEEMLRQHPDLRLEEIYAAMTYFYDHREALVRQMQEQAETVEKIRAAQSLSRADLLARKKEPR